jgi:hypothetical protein
MPAHLEAWWREHPERWSQRHRHCHGFPADGTRGEQTDWFRRQFLKLAKNASSNKERGEFLKLAFMATLKGENAGSADEVQAQYRGHLERMNQQVEEARAQRIGTITAPTDREKEILKHFQNTLYRNKDREMPDDPFSTDQS